MSDKGSEPKVSALGADDPFFPREGKSLMWKNVNMSIAGKKDEESKKLLHNIWGEVPKKEITAIMGPSGAGKSSLLNILAGRTRTKGNLTVSADVRLDDFGVDPTDVEVRKQIAFVAQDDSLTATATPRECIRFSAKLRLPRTTTDDELDALTTRMLEALGLTHCADTIVGGALLKGISGGERKRTSVGVELVTKPALVFLDEPTSGLDSYSATQLVDILHKVANAGSSVLFTIHQPSSEIFNAFDHLLLLNKGHVMYNGSVNKIPQYFEARNHPVPPNFNPADWIMDVAQTNPIEQLRSDGFFENDRRFSQLGTSMRMLGAKGAMDDSREGDVDSVGFSTQVRMLFVREWKNTKRDTSALGARFGITLFICTLYGLVFWRTAASSNSDYNDVQGHFGALMIIIINNMFGAAQPVLFAITDSRPVFLREYSTNHYSVGAYFIARLTIEFLETFLQVLLSMLITYWMIGYRANFMIFLAINFSVAFNATAMSVLLGCSVKDSQMGQEVMPLIFIPQLLFAGFFVSTDLLPEFLQWVPYICTMTYAVKLAVVAEFSPCIDNEDDPNSFCQNIFDRVQAEKNDVWWYWLVSVLIFVVIRLLALYALKRKASVFY